MVLALAIRGLYRGLIVQAFGVVGVVVGLWAAAWVSQWVGTHWQGARPAALFWALQWLVSLLAGLALAGLLHWWGTTLGEAVREGPLGWLDRSAGVLAGAAIGVLAVTGVVLLMLVAPGPRSIGDPAARARIAAPLMHGGSRACEWAGRWIPGGATLREGFLAAERRIVR